MRAVKWGKWAFLLVCTALTVAGVCLICWPGRSVAALCTLLGALIALQGVIRIFCYFSHDLYRLAFQFDLALGILSILTGALLLFYPQRIAAALPIAAGMFLLLESGLRLQTAVDARAFGMQCWQLLVALAVGGLVLGGLLLIFPFAGGRVLARVTGAAMAAEGVQSFLICLFTVRVPKRSAADRGEGGADPAAPVIDVEFTPVDSGGH